MNKRKRTATVTFHGAHNYGSVLQAYALQQVIRQLGYTNDIINLRTARQKDLYTVFTKRKGIKYILKNLIHAWYYRPLKRKYDKFEEFIATKLSLTDEYATEEELKDAKFDYDCYIAGSDQIWNPVPTDFDWSYYLTFVSHGRKISYAPSFGQLSSLGSEDTRNKIACELKSFDKISVREKGSAENVELLTGTSPDIVLDPTLLLQKERWLRLIDTEKPIIDGDYIFFYTLFSDPRCMQIVKTISKELNLKVIVSNFSNQYDVVTPFEKVYDTGPLDFLNLVYNARLSVCSSFHGTVFSVIFNTPFLAIDGLDDARITTLLTNCKLEHRAVTDKNIKEKCAIAMDTSDFEVANSQLEILRNRSIDFLKNNI